MTSQDLFRAFAEPEVAAPCPIEGSTRAPQNAVDQRALEARFESWLRLWLPVHLSIAVTFTKNRRSLLSYRRSHTQVALRLHRLFAHAGPDIAQAVCLYVLGHGGQARGHKDALKRYLASIECRQTKSPVAATVLRSQGAVHELQPLFDDLNGKEFFGRCTAAITWSKSAAPRRRRRSITLGSYTPELNLIRIHPCLDQAFVPEYVVRGVVHHEMLHELLGIEEKNGRRRMHPPEFVAIERMYGDYQRCLAWENQHLARLLRYRP